MKTGIIMLLLACVFLGSGCQKEDESKIPKWSKITALKNGEPWEAMGTGRLIKKPGSPDRINLRANVVW